MEARSARKHQSLPSQAQAGGIRYHDEALSSFGIGEMSEAIKQNPAFVVARLARAALHIVGGNFVRAFADFDAVLRIEPLCVGAYVNRAVLLFQMKKNTVEAMANLNEAISIAEVPRLALNATPMGQPATMMLAVAL